VDTVDETNAGSSDGNANGDVTFDLSFGLKVCERVDIESPSVFSFIENPDVEFRRDWDIDLELVFRDLPPFDF
jgi:hypothetical protein